MNIQREITILEDDDDIREVCNYLFTSEGYKVNDYSTISAFNASKSVPDIYLLDIRLPDGNGFEVCERVKNTPELADIPIIMMSAHLDASSAALNKCQAEAFIAKPFIIEDLLQRVAELIELSKK